MPIAITDEHQELGATVRGVLTAHGAVSAARALLEAETERLPNFWSEMAELGWLGIHLPERYGGAGAGLSELVVVLDELGRQVAPGPFLPTVLASAIVADCGSETDSAALLPGLADGSTVAALGLRGSLRLSDGVLDGDAGVVLGGDRRASRCCGAGDGHGRGGAPRRRRDLRWRQGRRPGAALGPGDRFLAPVASATCWSAPRVGRVPWRACSAPQRQWA